MQYPHKTTMVLRGFLFSALHQYSSQSVPKLKMSGPSFAKGGEPSPPASFLKNQQHEIIRQHAQCQLAADSFFSFFCKEKALINVYIRAFSFVLFRIFASCRILMPQRSTCLLWTGASAYLEIKRAFCIALVQASRQASTISPT
ncbi:MAG: hypothetical protein IJQ03_02635 [Firmicutes bacterium]|nr:hypothetical protein [Bacillota bacterium]